MPDSYETVLFDLDHTLLDSDASHAVAHDQTMRSVGIDDPTAVFDTFDRINQALWRRVEAGALSPNVVKELRFAQLLDELGVDGDPVEMGDVFVAALTAHGELYRGAFDVLAQLAERSTLGLITNGIGAVQRGRLDRLGLTGTFATVVISGEVGRNKPDRRIFDIAFAALGDPDRSGAVMVGDNLGSDIQGGINAGIDTIWYNPSGARNRTGIEPTHEVRALEEVVGLASRTSQTD